MSSQVVVWSLFVANWLATWWRGGESGSSADRLHRACERRSARTANGPRARGKKRVPVEEVACGGGSRQG